MSRGDHMSISTLILFFSLYFHHISFPSIFLFTTPFSSFLFSLMILPHPSLLFSPPFLSHLLLPSPRCYGQWQGRTPTPEPRPLGHPNDGHSAVCPPQARARVGRSTGATHCLTSKPNSSGVGLKHNRR